jgi:ornithine lipid ester-linked acyl 2-hydroxylase
MASFSAASTDGNVGDGCDGEQSVSCSAHATGASEDAPPRRGYLLEPEPYQCDSEEDEESLKHNNFYDNWEEHFPGVNLLKENASVILEEMKALSDWRPWPELNLYTQEREWNVFPFLHTFPATDASKQTWVEHFCSQCPKTVALLKSLPGIRTALFSRMGAGQVLAAHRGWADLANHVLRFHLALEVPAADSCGLWVRGEQRFHANGEVICFDDSKLHKAFNLSDKQRTVLIFDLLRPSGIPLGTAKKGHTDQLDDFIAWFQ